MRAPAVMPDPSADLRAGRRAVIGLDGVTLLRDLEWQKRLRKWVLLCRLTPEVAPNHFVPPTTDWYVLVSPAYPWGSITFYPAKQGGLAFTFQHQRYNAPG